MGKLRKGLALAAALLFTLGAALPTALASSTTPIVSLRAEATAYAWELGSTQELPTVRVIPSTDRYALTYQWYKGETGSGTLLQGETSASMKLTRAMLGSEIGTTVRFYCVVQSSEAMIFDSGNPPWVNILVRGPELVTTATTTSVNPFTQTAPITLNWRNTLSSALLDASAKAEWTCVEATEPGTTAAAPRIATTAAQITTTTVSGTISDVPALRGSASYTYTLTVQLADGIVVKKEGIHVQVTPVAGHDPQLDEPATWLTSPNLSVETLDGGRTYYVACGPNSFRTSSGGVADEQVQVSSTAITLPVSSPYFSPSSGLTGAIRISSETPIGAYEVEVQAAGGATAKVAIVVQGVLTTAGGGQTLQPGGTAALEAVLGNGATTRLPETAPAVTWDWTATEGLTVAKDSSTGVSSKATATVASNAPDGAGTVSVTASQNGVPLAATAEIGIQVKNPVQQATLSGISVYEMPDTATPLPAGQPLIANGRQYQLSANWTKEPTGTWTYTWTVARPAGATGGGTVPTLSSPSTVPDVWFIPNASNVGAWTISVRATSGDGGVAEASAAVRIDRATIEPGISSYEPLGTTLMAVPGETLDFAVTPSAGSDAQGNRVAGEVYWVERTADKETVKFTPSSTYTCSMPAEGSLTVTGYVASAGWQPTESPDFTGKPLVTWTISPASPTPSINGALSIDPYAGTIVTDAETKTPAASVAIGGYATFGVALASTNDPADFTFTWETRADASSAWQNAASFAGMEGQAYTTPLMTMDMDGSQYRVRVTNKDDSTLAVVSSAVSLILDSANLTPRVSIHTDSPPLNEYQNPETLTVGEGTDVTMYADVEVPYGVEYKLQWYRANSLEAGQTQYTWQEINGATTDSYTLRSARAMDDGDLYRCVATVDYSTGLTGTSDPVRIVVMDEDGWVTVDRVLANGEPQDLIAYSPDDPPALSVEAKALDGGALGYQWYMNRSGSGNQRIEGATEATYTPTALGAGGTYEIWCEVRNVNVSSLPAVASNSVMVVYPMAATRPTITAQPVDSYDATPGETVNISVEAVAESGDTLSYAWQSAPWQSDAWAAIAQATGSTLRLPSVPLSYNGRQYRCVVTNTVTKEAVTSDTCTLYVFDSDAYLRVSAPPAETVAQLPILADRSISAAVRVSASQDLSKYSYEWQYSDTQDGRYESTGVKGDLAALAATSTTQGDYVINVPLALLQNGAPIATGYYQLCVTNVGSSDQGIYATSTSQPGYVLIAPEAVPYITRQPQDQSVPQGSSGAFSVTAAISGGRPLYRWQKWVYESPAGNVDSNPPTPGLIGYWSSCDGDDGTGISASTFTTVETNAEMRLAAYYEQPIYYRCLVYDATNGNMTASRPALLTVTQEEPVVPTLDPLPDSALKLEGTGENRRLDGLTATSAGTTVEDVLKEMAPVRRGQIVITDKDGKVRTPGEIVATGDYIEIRFPDGTTADRAVIVVMGDVVGSGRISLTQVVAMCAAWNGTKPLVGPYLLAGDLTGSGTITLTDLVRETAMYQNAMNPDRPTDPDPSPAPTGTPGPSTDPDAPTTPDPSPSDAPTGTPTGGASAAPTGAPSTTPTDTPSAAPTDSASATPSDQPTDSGEDVG